MTDIFISFRTDDTWRVQPIYEALRARGLSVFWSNDIPKGASNYQDVIIEEMRNAAVVVVLWTHTSVQSHAVAQECSQASRNNKLFQVVLDDIEPIRFPMEAGYRAQKTNLIGWDGNAGNREWVRLNEAIDARLMRRASSPRSAASPPPLQAPLPQSEASPAYFGQRPPALPRTAGPSQATQSPLSRPMAATAGHAQIPEPGTGKTQWFKDLDIGPELVVVPAGEFVMGWNDHEQRMPLHKVRIPRPLAVGRFAVTFAEWDAAGLSQKRRAGDMGWGRGNLPVINVSWNDATSYIQWLTKHSGQCYRLLSEAEWEYCCRAGTVTRFWWGNDISPSMATYSESNERRTLPVDSFLPNPWGLYQVSGNVNEWVEDTWHPNYRGAPDDGSPWIGPDMSERVMRGGSWACYGEIGVNSAARSSHKPSDRFAGLGFRLARVI